MGSQISPVVQAYLAGQGKGTDLLQLAHAIIAQRQEATQRQQALDDAMKRFGVESKQAQERIQQQADLLKLHTQTATQTAMDNIMEEFATGKRQPEGFMAAPPSTHMITPNPVNIPGFGPVTTNPQSEEPRAAELQPYSEQIVDTAFGPMTVKGIRTPKMQFEEAFPRMLKETEAKEAIKSKYEIGPKLEAMQEINRIRNQYAETVANIRARATEYAADASAQARIEAALLGQQRAFMMQMFNMGMAGPDEIKKSAWEVATGRTDFKEFSNPALKNQIKMAMQGMGLHTLPGGAETRKSISNMAGMGAKLINDFDELNAQFPPSKNIVGQSLQWGKTAPVIGHFTGEGRRYNQYKSNLMQFARTVLDITSGRLIDTNKEQVRTEGGMPHPTDDLKIRQTKRLGLIDNIFTHIQGQIGGLSLPQRQDFWQEVFSKDVLADLGNDPLFRNTVMKKIEATGKFDSSYLNDLRRVAGAKK